MSEFLFFNILILFTIILLFIILSWIWPPDSPWAPWWRTSKEKARAVCKLAKVTKKDTVYELGSGEGNVLIVAAKEHGAKGVGIEIDYFRALLSRMEIILRGISGKVEIKRNDIFKENLSDATVVFCYLVPKTLKRLQPKLLRELKPNTRLVSLLYTFTLPLIAEDKTHNLYLYKIPSLKTRK